MTIKRRQKIGFLLTHPIQYYSPLFRYLSAHANFDTKVYYQSSCSVKGHFEKEFGRTVVWDNDLLKDYDFEFLPCIAGNSMLSRTRPLCYGLKKRLVSNCISVLFILGYNRPFHIYAAWLCWRLGIKSVIRDDSTLFSKHRGRFKNALKRAYLRYFTAMGVDFLAVGTANREYYLANGVPARRIGTMHWAVDAQFFQSIASAQQHEVSALRSELGLREGQVTFLFVGKLVERKGIRHLVSSFLSVHRSLGDRVALVLVGDGELRDIVDEASRVCADMKLVGFKNQSELPLFYSLCDVLVLPSLISETWGLVVNEAISLGKPVIVSDRVGCWPDVIKSGVGWVYGADDPNNLASVLRRIAELPNIHKWASDNAEAFSAFGESFSFEQNRRTLDQLALE